MSTHAFQKKTTQFLIFLGNQVTILLEDMPSYTGPRTEYGKIRAVEREEARKRREHYQRIQYLKRKKWVDIKRTENGLLITLSNRGKKEAAKRSIATRPKLPSKQTLLVLYDFPREARKGRDALRHFLKTLGFTQMQLSVWQHNRDCVVDLERFIRETKIHKWVKVYIGSKR